MELFAKIVNSLKTYEEQMSEKINGIAITLLEKNNIAKKTT